MLQWVRRIIGHFKVRQILHITSRRAAAPIYLLTPTTPLSDIPRCLLTSSPFPPLPLSDPLPGCTFVLIRVLQ